MWEYSKDESSIFSSKTPSSSLRVLKFLSNKLTVQLLILAVTWAVFPGATKLICVLPSIYPIPPLITLISDIFPSETNGVKRAYLPSGLLISTSGGAW